MTNETDEDDPLIGKTLIGRFKILEPLGSGGMGRVYKALQSPLDRLVALKVLNPKYSSTSDSAFQQRFFKEAELTAKLHHPNTVTIHDFGRTEDGMLFIAMEYVEGQTLQQVLAKDETISWPRALNIAGQICRSLREAHKLGVIHRDLKPANVMVLHEETGSDLVKVLDFGLVKEIKREQVSPNLTQAGVLLGSPLYMAPESAKGTADARADIYSLGVLLFQIISGEPPFNGKDSIDIIVKHVREKPPRLKAMKPGVPDAVDALVMRCLEKDPNARFQTMDEVLEALKIVTAEAGHSAPFLDPQRSLEVPMVSAELLTPDRSRAPVLIASAVVLLGAAALAYQTLKPKPPPPAPTLPAAIATPTPTPEPEPKHEPEPQPPAQVTFDVSSTPGGATVSTEGRVLGVTPFTFPLEGESASAQLTFALEGYQTVTVTAEGSGTVPVAQVLRKRGTKKKPANGYKDDPYQ